MCRFFKDSSEEEREHAEKFMEYQVLTVFFVILFFSNSTEFVM